MAFHTRMGDIQAAVSRRERVLVRSHGRPWAIVVAGEGYKPESPKAQDFVAAGMWVDREDMSDPIGYVHNLRKKRSTNENISARAMTISDRAYFVGSWNG